LLQGENAVDDGLEFPSRKPLQGGEHIGARAAVTADQLLLLDEERPEIELNLAPGRGAAGHDAAAARQALEGLLQDVSAHVFHDQIDPSFLGQFAHLGGPILGSGINAAARAPNDRASSRFAGVDPVAMT
jgi:hypothetical protein